jgi:altronate dehydratase
MIFFVTGNGSITNFPFVPTLKIITTTERYQLLSSEMDVNAGAYLDGVAMEDIGAHTFEHTLKIASGERSVGERAGHSQVQIWRDWQQTQPTDLAPIPPIPLRGTTACGCPLDCPYALQIPVYVRDDHATTDQVALILPTSLCSGQIAACVLTSSTATAQGANIGISRFVTLVHTEGCGGSVNVEFKDTLVGYLGILLSPMPSC